MFQGEYAVSVNVLPHDHGINIRELSSELPAERVFETVSELLKTMSDANRIRIFWLLCHCEECVVNISALLGITSSVASHHLKLLKTSGLITSVREGKEVYYTASKTDRAELLHEMIERTMEVECPSEDVGTLLVSRADDSYVGTVTEVQKLLTRDLTRRYTIEELSSIFHINRTTLKATFKKVFGQPIGVYMKDYRIKRAKELLCHSTRSISEISGDVGYENRSKFTSAFRNLTGMLPKDYRKAHEKRHSRQTKNM